MTTLTGGEVVLRCLAQEGVKRVIGITDEGYHTIQHHCREYGIRFVAPRHEAAGAHIAQGIYKSSGEVSAVLSGGGPGTANVLAGVICAKTNKEANLIPPDAEAFAEVYTGVEE
jgi:acetolactate synthase-1/2/3 large subunit